MFFSGVTIVLYLNFLLTQAKQLDWTDFDGNRIDDESTSRGQERINLSVPGFYTNLIKHKIFNIVHQFSCN